MEPKPTTADRANTVEALADLLAAYPPNLRRKLEARVGLKRGGSRARSTAQLAKALLDADHVAAELDRCRPDDREFLASVARCGGERSISATDWWLRRRGIDDPSLVIGPLVEQGLLFLVGPPHGPAPDTDLHEGDSEADPLPTRQMSGSVWVPEPIRQRLKQLLPEGALPEKAEPFVVERAGLPDLIRELFVLARFVAARSPRALTTTRHLSRDEFVTLAGELGQRDRAEKARRLEQLPELLWLEAVAAQAGLIAVEDRHFVATPHVERFFSLSDAEQCRELVEAVVSQTRWGELATAPDVMIDRSLAGPPGHSDVPSPGGRVRARRTVLRVLREAGVPGVWHSTESLAHRVMDLYPEFLIRRRPPGVASQGRAAPREPAYRGLLRGDSRHSQPVGMVSGWEAVEGVFIARLVEVSLRRVGLVDVGPVEEDACFRVTELGARALGMIDDAAGAAEDERPPGRFFLQPNFEIIADGSGDNIGAIWRLSRVAELVSFDRAALLKVTCESICRALDEGITRNEIIKTLDDDGRIELPQNVIFSVDEWIDAYQRYEMQTGVWLVETDRPEELDGLENDLPHCLQRIGPTAARVKPAHRREVSDALSKRDDALEIDHSAGIGPAFSIDDRMNVTTDPSRWHWYLDHTLSKIAEPARGKGRRRRYQLTQESVQRGLEGGLTTEDICSFIESGADRPLSPTQAFLLHGWLGLYEPVELASATVLRVPPQAAVHLVTVPEIREAILGGLGSGIFVVDPRAASRLARLLQKAGVPVAREVRAVPLRRKPAADQLQGAPAVAAPQRWGRRRWQVGEAEEDKAAVLESAILAGRQVLVDYRSVVHGEPSRELVLSPQSLEQSRWGQRRLHAYCHWRKTYRTFDVSRMDAIVTLDEPASFPSASDEESPD